MCCENRFLIDRTRIGNSEVAVSMYKPIKSKIPRKWLSSVSQLEVGRQTPVIEGKSIGQGKTDRARARIYEPPPLRCGMRWRASTSPDASRGNIRKYASAPTMTPKTLLATQRPVRPSIRSTRTRRRTWPPNREPTASDNGSSPLPAYQLQRRREKNNKDIALKITINSCAASSLRTVSW